MGAPSPVEGAQFFDFIGGAPMSVVLISAHRWHTFNAALAQQLTADHQGMALGTVDLGGLIVGNTPALRFVHQGLRACGAPAAFGALPGYCLFRERELLAWDAGWPGFTDLAAVARSAMIGVVCSGITHDVSFIGQALRLAADHAAAVRVAAHFRHAAAAPRGQERETRAPHAPPVDEVFWAYQTLGVLPTATDDEVHRAWRRRRMEHHPDVVASDPTEFERRSRLSSDINRARDIIGGYRSGSTRGPSYAWAS